MRQWDHTHFAEQSDLIPTWNFVFDWKWTGPNNWSWNSLCLFFSDGQIGKFCIVKIKFSLLPSQHFTLTIWAFWKIKYQWLSYYHDMCSACTSSMEGCFSWQWISTSFMTLATIPDVFMAFLSIFNKKQQKFKDMLVANWRTHTTKCLTDAFNTKTPQVDFFKSRLVRTSQKQWQMHVFYIWHFNSC